MQVYAYVYSIWCIREINTFYKDNMQFIFARLSTYLFFHILQHCSNATVRCYNNRGLGAIGTRHGDV